MTDADDEHLAPVVPLRSDEDELVLLETAVLDQLDDQDAAAADDSEPVVQPIVRHRSRRSPRRPPA